MNHQQFENLIFQDEPLENNERIQLRDHLTECSQCRDLSMAWKAVGWQLNQSAMAAPEPGFISRWNDRLVVEKKRAHKRQGVLFLSLSLGAALLLSLGILMVTVPIFQSPGLLFWTYVDRLLSVLETVDILRDIIFSLYLSIGQELSGSPGWITYLPLIMILAAGLAIEMLVLWCVTVRKITVHRGMSV